jgi:hypothetical protein
MSDYTPTDKPINGAWNVSKVIRDEFALIETAVNSKADSFGTSSVSTTSMVISDILQTFTMETGKEFIPGMTIYMGDSTAPATNYMLGLLVSYNSVTGLSSALITSHVGSGTIASWVIGLSNSNGATLVNNAFTGHQDFARATVASHATTADIWSALGNQIDFTGTATVTAFPAALQTGAHRELICAGACTFTAGANMLIDGVDSGSSITCAANDKVIVRAITLTQFNITRIRYDGRPQKEITRNEVLLHSGNGLGSINTYIRRYTTAAVNTGTALTYADSATLGASVTVNEAGLYQVSCYDLIIAGTVCSFGVSRNSTQLTTGIAAITVTDRLCLGSSIATNPYNQTTALAWCAAGDVLLPHANSVLNDGTSSLTFMHVLKVANA